MGDNFRYPHSYGVICRTKPVSVISNCYSHEDLARVLLNFGKEQRIKDDAGRRASRKNRTEFVDHDAFGQILRKWHHLKLRMDVTRLPLSEHLLETASSVYPREGGTL